MDFYVILVMVWWLKDDGGVHWADRAYGDDMQTCYSELAAIKAEKMSHPEIKSVVAYCIPFTPAREAAR